MNLSLGRWQLGTLAQWVGFAWRFCAGLALAWLYLKLLAVIGLTPWNDPEEAVSPFTWALMASVMLLYGVPMLWAGKRRDEPGGLLTAAGILLLLAVPADGWVLRFALAAVVSFGVGAANAKQEPLTALLLWAVGFFIALMMLGYILGVRDAKEVLQLALVSLIFSLIGWGMCRLTSPQPPATPPGHKRPSPPAS
jgi:hypothetical protein